MEQDRTPAVFIHLIELAWGAFERLRDRCEDDLSHDNQQRIESDLPVGSAQIPDRPESYRQRNEVLMFGEKQFPWRLELLYPAKVERLS